MPFSIATESGFAFKRSFCLKGKSYEPTKAELTRESIPF